MRILLVIYCLFLFSTHGFSRGLVEQRSSYSFFRSTKTINKETLEKTIFEGLDDLAAYQSKLLECAKQNVDIPSALFTLEGFKKDEKLELINYISQSGLHFTVLNMEKVLPLAAEELEKILDQVSKDASAWTMSGKKHIIFLNHFETMALTMRVEQFPVLETFFRRSTASSSKYTIVALLNSESAAFTPFEESFDEIIKLKTTAKVEQEIKEAQALKLKQTHEARKEELEKEIDIFFDDVMESTLNKADNVYEVVATIFDKIKKIDELGKQHPNLEKYSRKVLSNKDLDELEQQIEDSYSNLLQYIFVDSGFLLVDIVNTLKTIKQRGDELEKSFTSNMYNEVLKNKLKKKIDIVEEKLIAKLAERSGIVIEENPDTNVVFMDFYKKNKSILQSLYFISGGSHETYPLLPQEATEDENLTEKEIVPLAKQLVDDWKQYEDMLPGAVADFKNLTGNIYKLQDLLEKTPCKEDLGSHLHSGASLSDAELQIKDLSNKIFGSDLRPLLLKVAFAMDLQTKIQYLQKKTKLADLEDNIHVKFVISNLSKNSRIDYLLNKELSTQLGLSSEEDFKTEFYRIAKSVEFILEKFYGLDSDIINEFMKIPTNS